MLGKYKNEREEFGQDDAAEKVSYIRCFGLTALVIGSLFVSVVGKQFYEGRQNYIDFYPRAATLNGRKFTYNVKYAKSQRLGPTVMDKNNDRNYTIEPAYETGDCIMIAPEKTPVRRQNE